MISNTNGSTLKYFKNDSFTMLFNVYATPKAKNNTCITILTILFAINLSTEFSNIIPISNPHNKYNIYLHKLIIVSQYQSSIAYWMRQILAFSFSNATKTIPIMSKVKYIGGLRCQSEHLQSKTKINSDAPTDNQGKGQCFSPTDMCSVSLAECVLTTIAILGKTKNIDIINSTCQVQKIMTANPRRIGQIVCKFHFVGNYSDLDRKWIQDTAHNCPVAKSLHPELKQTMVFGYEKK